MKKVYGIGVYGIWLRAFLFLISLYLIPYTSFPQWVWTQKSSFTGSPRSGATAFSIGASAYVGTGNDSVGFKRSFYQYDSNGDVWIPTTNLGGITGSGLERDLAAGFSIGNKGFIGTGQGVNPYLKDFWEYDSETTAWTQLSDFGGTGRRGAVGFSIGGKGYIGTGQDISGFKKDFWEYDTLNNLWTKKSDFGGTGRKSAVGFSIGTKGYIGTGDDGVSRKDFWEYDSSSDMWSPKNDFGGTARNGAAAFSIGGKGYIGTGYDINITYTKDFWEYDTLSGLWSVQQNLPGTPRANAVGFSIGDKGYIGTGYDNYTTAELWEFSAPAGVNEMQDAGYRIRVEPNPSEGKFVVQITNQSRPARPAGGFTDYELKIFNTLGEEVALFNSHNRGEFNSLPSGGLGWALDISNHPKGIYFVKLVLPAPYSSGRGEKVSIQKIIVR